MKYHFNTNLHTQQHSIPQTFTNPNPATNISTRLTYNQHPRPPIRTPIDLTNTTSESMWGGISDADLAQLDTTVQKTRTIQIAQQPSQTQPDYYAGIPDHGFLQITLLETQNRTQKKRKITKNPYKK